MAYPFVRRYYSYKIFSLFFLIVYSLQLVQCQKEIKEGGESIYETYHNPAQVLDSMPIPLTLCALKDHSIEVALEILEESDFKKRNNIEMDVILLEYEPMIIAHKLDFTSKKRRFDLVTIDQPSLGWYVKQYWIQPLDYNMSNSRLPSTDVDDIIPILLESSKWEDMIYSIPIGSYGAVFAYRKDIFNEAGLKPPVTFEEFRSMAEKINQPPYIYGTALFAHKGEYLTADVAPFLWSWGAGLINGVDVFLPDKPLYQAAWDTPEGLAALEFYASLYYDGLTPPDTLNYDHLRYIHAFQEGKVAMGFMPTEGIGWPMDNPDESTVVGKIGYAPLPGRKEEGVLSPPQAALGAHGLGISTFSKNHQDAFRVLQFLTSREIGREYILRGGLPFRSSHFFPEAMDKLPYLDAIKIGMESGHYRPRIPLYPEVSNIFSSALHLGLSFNEPVSSIMKAAAEKANREILIPEYGLYEDSSHEN